MSIHSRKAFLLGTSISIAAIAATLGALSWYGRLASQQQERADRARSFAVSGADEGGDAALADRVAPDRTATRGAVPATEPDDGPFDGVERVDVEILRAEGGSPLAQAEACWWATGVADGSDDGFEAWLRSSTLEEQRGSALVLRADERGFVRVPWSPQGFSLAASSGDLWGAATYGAHEQRAILRLARDTSLRVRVVDAAGVPVTDVMVALRQRRASSTRDVLTARTESPDGIAVLRHAARFLQADAPIPAEPFRITVPGLFDAPVEAPLDDALASTAPVTLVLPPSGSCSVLVVDAQDRPVSGPLEARLTFLDEGAPGGIAHLSEDLVVRRAESVVFERVGLGRTLAVQVTRESSGARLEARGRGPREPGERVVLRVPIGADSAVVRGRLVDPGGNPIAGCAAVAQLEATGQRAPCDTLWRVATSSDGSFAFDIAPIADVPAGVVLAFRRRSEDGSLISSGRGPLLRDLGAGVHDLGDIVLVEAVILAAGRIVDGEGRPVAGADVGATPVFDREPDEQGHKRVPEEIASTRSDGRGRFELRGEARTGSLVLVAEKQDLVGDPMVVQAGQRDLRLLLRTASTIEGRVLLDPSLAQALVLVEAQPGGGAVQDAIPPGGMAASPLRTGGRFILDGLRAGRYSMRVVHAATGTVLAEVPALVVREGERTRDARLDPLDLRARYRLLDLEPVDEGGQPIPEARAVSRPSGDVDARWVFAPRERGHLMLLCDARPLDVVISAAGYVRSEIERIDTSQRIVLRPAARLRLRLGGSARLPAAPLRLGVELVPLDSVRTSMLADAGPAWFDGDGLLTCASPCAGDLRVEFVLLRRTPSAATMERIEPKSPLVLHVADHAGEQDFEIRLDEAELEAAAHALEGEH